MQQPSLVRATGLVGAMLLGLGSILGTGAYVSVGIGAEIANTWVVLAICVAALTALFNGMSSAQLAAVHPVSGGTYEYGYRFLTPAAGVAAGSLFVIAKSASAAAAAMAVGTYFGSLFALPSWGTQVIALALIFVFTLLVLGGVKRTSMANAVLVLLSIAGLLIFVWMSLLADSPQATQSKISFEFDHFFQAAALLFVAFTGYGRIATMGEEITEPRKNIPRAIFLTLLVVSLIYIAVGYALMQYPLTGVGSAVGFSLSMLMPTGWAQWAVALGAIIAMCGVLLNLILGVSRVVLAMGRREDLPVHFAGLNASQTSAPAATWLTAAVMAAVVIFGDLKSAWSLSAFTVLVYYGLTNLAALKVSSAERFIPQWMSVLGLLSCFGLALFVPWQSLLLGVVLIAFILLIHALREKRRA
ncbi:MAG: APC superfamily amino acid-polyamine transporter [Idiomarinaceae bacterium HL-53]|nr:MAG: APC superfamily amino acid-polyamine transporter [Idiomarinaceae bacterium HL-53]CUS48299.1 amino acid/polyamine/organocation transporter, APC superfamily (TC 2.A.3) [Idiomarinaceae bacterium HL-53]